MFFKDQFSRFFFLAFLKNIQTKWLHFKLFLMYVTLLVLLCILISIFVLELLQYSVAEILEDKLHFQLNELTFVKVTLAQQVWSEMSEILPGFRRMGWLRSYRALLAAHSTFLGLQALHDISGSSCFCGYDLLLRVKPLCKQEGLQTHSVLLSRASGHLFQFPMTTLLLQFAVQKNTSICSINARQGRGVGNTDCTSTHY